MFKLVPNKINVSISKRKKIVKLFVSFQTFKRKLGKKV